MLQPTDPVLIVYLPKPRDLELARSRHWYRIPMEHAPRALVPAKALAFYQGRSFGKQRWRIAHWAPIRRRVEITRRELLPDEPDHPRADEPYVKVELGEVQSLPQPLTSDHGRRLLFKGTVWGRLVQATSLDELFTARPVADDPLYQIMKSQFDDDAFDVGDSEEPHQRRLFETEASPDTW